MFNPSMSMRTLVFCATSLLCGCANVVYYTQLQPSPRTLEPRPVQEVETFAVTPPQRPHQVVGLFQVVQGGADDESLMTTLRARAAAMGCDAIVITSIDHRSNKYQSPNIQASCVVYDRPPAADSMGSGVPAVTDRAPPKRDLRLAVAVASPTEVRTAPHLIAPLVVRIPRGERVWVSGDASNGWRLATLPDGRVGYIQDAALGLE